jgi:hypothetical protein
MRKLQSWAKVWLFSMQITSTFECTLKPVTLRSWRQGWTRRGQRRSWEQQSSWLQLTSVLLAFHKTNATPLHLPLEKHLQISGCCGPFIFLWAGMTSPLVQVQVHWVELSIYVYIIGWHGKISYNFLLLVMACTGALTLVQKRGMVLALRKTWNGHKAWWDLLDDACFDTV